MSAAAVGHKLVEASVVPAALDTVAGNNVSSCGRRPITKTYSFSTHLLRTEISLLSDKGFCCFASTGQ